MWSGAAHKLTEKGTQTNGSGRKQWAKQLLYLKCVRRKLYTKLWRKAERKRDNKVI